MGVLDRFAQVVDWPGAVLGILFVVPPGPFSVHLFMAGLFCQHMADTTTQLYLGTFFIFPCPPIPWVVPREGPDCREPFRNRGGQIRWG